MIYQLDKIMQDVRICLDQNMMSDALLESGDIDTLSLDEIIKSKILEAVQRVHMSAPNYLLEVGHNFGDAVYWRELESGWVLLPPDFMRLVVFEMDDWEQAVYQAIRLLSDCDLWWHFRIHPTCRPSRHCGLPKRHRLYVLS